MKVVTVAINASVKQAAPYLREHLPGARVRKHKDPRKKVIYIQHPKLQGYSFDTLSLMAEQHDIPVLDIGEREQFGG
jgi:hypothetical protein